MLWFWSGPPESYCWFSFASAFQLFLAIESSSLFHLCIRLIFMFSEMLHWWVRYPSRGLNKYLEYTTVELRARVVFLCFSVLLALRLPRLGKRELMLLLFVRLFDLCLFCFVGFFFLLVSGKGCGLWLRHSLDFSLTFCGHVKSIEAFPTPHPPPPQNFFLTAPRRSFCCGLLFLSLYTFACMSWWFVFILDSPLAIFWGRNCPFGYLLVVFWLWRRFFYVSPSFPLVSWSEGVR